MFQHIDPYAGDPILSLMEEFKDDQRTKKVNLSIGLYYNEDNIIPQLKCIQRAYTHLIPDFDKVRGYLPMDGLNTFNQATQQLIFGKNSSSYQQNRLVTIQTLGGSGALKVGADFLKKYFPQSDIWVSQPTWENHITIFTGAGIKTHFYPYYDEQTHAVNLSGILETLNQIPSQSIVLLHPCCHNPTGADLQPHEWDQVIHVLKEKNLIPFLDMAYQGFGQGLELDSYAIHALDKAGMNFIVSHSFSKIFSLYGERIGSLSIVCDNNLIAQNVLGQLKATVRKIYSSPAANGAMLVSQVLNDPELLTLWVSELEEMRQRISLMRSSLKNKLTQLLPEVSFDYLTQQQGMFSYTGLTVQQVDILKQQYGIYLVHSGRMCVAGLNLDNIDYVAESISTVIKSTT
jgi:aromatic-amino-acid transaminase